jgi:hypothetical protein
VAQWVPVLIEVGVPAWVVNPVASQVERPQLSRTAYRYAVFPPLGADWSLQVTAKFLMCQQQAEQWVVGNVVLAKSAVAARAGTLPGA